MRDTDHLPLINEQHRSFTQPSQYGSFIGREEYAKLRNTIYKPLDPTIGNKPKYKNHDNTQAKN